MPRLDQEAVIVTAMDDFYPAYLHYTVAMRLFEDTCRQLCDCQGGQEERSQLVDETIRLAMCVEDNIDDVESLLAPAVREAVGDQAMTEALSLITNTLKEDRARVNSYSRYITYRRIGSYDRAPRRPLVANPFVPLLDEEQQRPEVEDQVDGDEEPDERSYGPDEPLDDEDPDDGEDVSEHPDGQEGPDDESPGSEAYDEEDDGSIDRRIDRSIRPTDDDEDDEYGDDEADDEDEDGRRDAVEEESASASDDEEVHRGSANPLVEETRRIMSEHGLDPDMLNGDVDGVRMQGRHVEVDKRPTVRRQARAPLRRTVRRRCRSRSCCRSR